MKTALIAIGGNSLIRAGEKGTVAEQLANARRTAAAIIGLIRDGYHLVLTHGNGPQVGAALRDAIAAPVAGQDGLSSLRNNLGEAVKQVGPGSNWDRVRKILPAYAKTYDLEAFHREGAFNPPPAQTVAVKIEQLGQWIEAIGAYRNVTDVDPRKAIRQKLTDLKNDVATRRQTGQLSAEKLTELKVDESLAAVSISSRTSFARPSCSSAPSISSSTIAPLTSVRDPH